MKKLIYQLYVFILGCVFILSASGLNAEKLKIGDKAPNLIGLNAKNGKRINLNRLMTNMQFKRDEKGNLLVGSSGKYISEFVDNVVVLNFFQRTCIPCLKEIPTFNKIAKKFITNNIKFLYVNIDSGITIANARQLIKKLKIRIPVMLPNQKEAMRKYRVTKLPRLYVINKEKKISHIVSGFEENLESELTSVINNLL